MNQAEKMGLFFSRKYFLHQFVASRDRGWPFVDRMESVELLEACLEQLPDAAFKYRTHWPRTRDKRRVRVRGLPLGPYFSTSLAFMLGVPDTPILFARWNHSHGFVRVDHTTREVVELIEPERFSGRHIMSSLAWSELDQLISRYL